MDDSANRQKAAPARGARSNPDHRFALVTFEADADELDHAAEFGEASEPRTRFVRDSSRSVVSRNSSPDIYFDVSLNPYRGCEHGCSYCYARPTHEYLGLSAGLDFERIILVKEDAPALLERELRRKNWRPQFMMLSGVTDPYQPVERHLRITRGCLEVLLRFRHPVGVITKNHLVTRDIDILAELAALDLVKVTLSITTLDESLRRRLEPRTSTAARRLAAVGKLAAAGVPVGVNVAPLIPGLNDHEIPTILEAAANAGAVSAGYTVLRLPGAVAGVFSGWLEEHYPERAGKVLGRVRQMRDGKLNNPEFGKRMRPDGPYGDQIRELFRVARERHGLDRHRAPLRTDLFRVPGSVTQPGLFEPE